MSSLEKKKKKHSLESSPESTPIPSLPEDLLVSCFARVSTLYYPTLSLVSKRFRSLLTSPELHQTRSILNRTESSLFVFSNQRWFTLCRKPNQTLIKATKSSGYVLAPISFRNSPPGLWRKSMVAVGSNVYAIGGRGRIHDAPTRPSSSVSILDCRSYTWREAPSMKVERCFTTANVLDGKIYVVGSGEHSNSMEVFDPKTQTWELVLSPLEDICGGGRIHKSAVIEGEIVMVGKKGVRYKPKEDRWEEIGWQYLDIGLGYNSCVIDNIHYSYCHSPRIKWYDFKRRVELFRFQNSGKRSS